MSEFVNLHVHDHFSLLDGATTPERNAKRAVEMGQTHLAQTNHGTLTGAYEHYKQCKAHGIVPIIGIEAYVAPESRHTKAPVYWGTPGQRKEDVGSQGAATHMLLFARDAEGLRNLYKLHELSYTEGFYRKPRIDLEVLEQHNAGVIATTGCAGGAVPTLLRLGLKEGACAALGRLRDIFAERLWIEVMHHGLDFDDYLTAELIEMSSWSGVPLLATADSHYAVPGDAEVHDAFLCLQTGAKLQDNDRFRFNGTGYHLMSAEEMHALPLPSEAIANTLKLASIIEPYDEVFAKRNLMPKWGSGSLQENATKALVRYNLGPEHKERLDYELGVIERMGYEDYFLVLADIVRWAHDQHILVGPGRGSAGGSLVAYLLGITELDPLKHGLLFERFLNPQRVSAPDIDVDFQDDRREEVIAYAVEKHGADRVAQVVTFGKIKAKAAIKDANRVMGGTYSEGEKLVSMIPAPIAGFDHPLEGLSKLQHANPDVYDLATGLEGLVRSTGKHAAGIIISPEPLSDIIPVKKDKTDNILTAAYDQATLEAHGLVKYDCLGLKELRIMQVALEIINETG